MTCTPIGWMFDQKKFSGETLARLESKFTVHIPNIMGGKDVYKCYFHSMKGGYYIFPRFGFNAGDRKILGLELPGETDTFRANTRKVDIPPSEECITLNEGQNAIAETILNRFEDPEFLGGTILKLEAGLGKTFIALYLIKVLQMRTLIVVHNTNLLFQWKELFEKYFDYKVGLLYGGCKDQQDVTISVINSCVKYAATLDYDFVILDECHELVTPERIKMYWYLKPAKYILGLSATPATRQNARDQFVPWLAGPILDASDVVPEFSIGNAPYEGEVTKVCYYGSPDFTRPLVNKVTGKTDVAKTVNMIIGDPARLNLIVYIAAECYNSGKNLFIFADRRDFLLEIREQLGKYLQAAGISDDLDNVVRLVGGASSDDIRDAEANRSIILTTYQFMGTGVSIKKMNAIIFATPRRNKLQQFVNRIFRLGSADSSKRLVYDIVDMHIDCFVSQWRTRQELYKQKGFSIKPEKKYYTDIPSIV